MPALRLLSGLACARHARSTERLVFWTPRGVRHWRCRIRRVQPKDVGFMVVPAMAFDRSGNRLGHGYGHYDRLMAKCPGYKVGLVFEVQIVDEVPMEPQDVAVDVVVTEQNLYPPASVRGGSV